MLDWLLLFPVYLADGPTLYTSEKEGNDESGDGSLQKPFKTVMRVEEKWIFTCMLTKLIIFGGIPWNSHQEILQWGLCNL